jgi:inner membrane protein
MEPITHLMTGAVLSRAGFNRKAAYATVAMTLAAEAPDLDTLWSIRGPIAGFQHHRGWTHTLLGLPLEAAVVVGVVWLGHRWYRKAGKHQKPPAAPVRWGLLYLFCIIALLSHLLLDWTNNYGLRPFFPFNPHWYAGSIVFIFEPVIFAVLLIALIAPMLFGLVNSEVGARRERFRGRGWAIAALISIVALWGLRAVEHQNAIRLVQNYDFTGEDNAQRSMQILRVSANPYPINPFRWHIVVDTPQFYLLGTADTLNDTITTHQQGDTIYKPPTTLDTLIAKRTWLGEVYLDWSSYPLVTETGTSQDGLTTVTFRDLRFMYDTSFMSGREDPPLSGAVILNADRRVIRMEMGGRIQH